MRHSGRTAEQIIAAVASRQHGVVTRAQLLAEGLSASQVVRLVRKGTLIRVHPGVYRVGHAAASTEAVYLAAVYACGEGALLSGRAAGHLLGLSRGKPPHPEVLCPTQRRIPGVLTHRTRSPHSRDATTFKKVPVTTVPRTLVDLAAVLSEEDLARACHEAQVRFRVTPSKVELVLERRANSPGAGPLRRILRGEVHVTLSKLERRFLELLRESGLPLPVTNRPAGGRRVDCRWPEHRLTVELDGYRYHSSRHAWEQDRRREREAHARGDQLRRFTYDDVFESPRPMLAELRSLLPTQPMLAEG
jgi:very-short-patch-repair endonuclease